MPLDGDFLARMPTHPGVYLMRDKKGRVIYVGKAKDLRTRVRAYFRPGGGDERPFVATGLLGRLVDDIETVVVNNEKEALLLENNLIKQYQPRFNVKLVDDKQYIVLRIDPDKSYPRVEVVRRFADDGARYFGPYHSATSARQTLKVLNRHFQLRTCTDHVLKNRQRPCILHQIKRCPAPCVLPVPEADYGAQVDDACLFLSGKKDELSSRLRERMRAHAGRLEYERAGQLRDQLQAVEKALITQTVMSTETDDQDVIGLRREGTLIELVVLFMRQGKLLGRRAFQLRDQEVPDEDVVEDFLRSYYELGSVIPDEVLLPVVLEPDTLEALSDWASSLRGRRVTVASPQRGGKRRLVELAIKNAVASATTRVSPASDALLALEKLEQRLGLRRLPRRIECFDVAHIQGIATVASMAVFVDGVAARKEYRTFKIKSATNDDFAAMYEVMSRRFRRAREEEPGWEPPDLLVIDGGKGQLSSTLAALDDLAMPLTGEEGFDVIALAKERTDAGGDDQPDRVYLRNVKDPILLRPNSAELFLLMRVRDEAHRFANTAHRRLRTRRTLRSALEDVAGVGLKRRRALLRHFGSVKKIRAASVEDIAAVPGMTQATAEAVKRFLGESREVAERAASAEGEGTPGEEGIATSGPRRDEASPAEEPGTERSP